MTVVYATTRDMPADYRRHYMRGWRASINPTDVAGYSPLERADMRDESAAWYDGYHDYAAGRDKWATPLSNGPESTPAAVAAIVTGRSTSPMGHVLWNTTRGDYVWFGAGSRLRLIFGDSLVTIEHPTADGTYDNARDARAALHAFLTAFPS